ncbi:MULTISPECIES: IS4 family transposase [Nostocales]|uniref:Transposase n=4 Tax=Nostocales TaxID=1161 RepID=A0A0C1N7R5_9CYAN|nr:IS4 family transposase [Tolypothrix bouteillei]KAF3883932.1 IS4 family transposase [Tolypothrix bouteillei VB521301]KAF3884316.1 IS4 family transposase [Tolypothrix bouteillei VB521301]KAF3886873.1 IS4 family transposase [Tolypothrix bouteillei VB521301]
MYQWAEKELESLDLGDRRREKRLRKMVEDLASQPGESVPQACGDIAATTAAYDFWKSPYFQPDDIRQAHQTSTIKRIESHQILLAIQDTTNIDLTHHPQTTGLGYLDCATSFGLKVHSSLVASIDGVPLGIIHQHVWTRELENLGISKKRHQRETAEKESQRWLDTEQAIHQLIPPEKIVVTVADSEADIFDLFNQERAQNFHLLIRGTHNRKVDHNAKYLHEAINATPARGELKVEVNRSPQQHWRIAHLTIRFATLDIAVPSNHIRRKQLNPVKLQVILAREENPPEGVSPISWLLLTSLEIKSLEDAARCVRWYTYRWLIERYHYALKSGCGIEKLQLETGRRIHMALATYSIVAWRLLWLTYEARMHPQTPCDTVLETHEWQSLCVTISQNPHPPQTPPSLNEAVRMIAKLGGFLGRTRDGEPGLKTIWRGLKRLHDIAATWKLLKNHCAT